jgi:hypothetical protein
MVKRKSFTIPSLRTLTSADPFQVTKNGRIYINGSKIVSYEPFADAFLSYLWSNKVDERQAYEHGLRDAKNAYRIDKGPVYTKPEYFKVKFVFHLFESYERQLYGLDQLYKDFKRSYKPHKESKLKPCRQGQQRNPVTNRCKSIKRSIRRRSKRKSRKRSIRRRRSVSRRSRFGSVKMGNESDYYNFSKTTSFGLTDYDTE